MLRKFSVFIMLIAFLCTANCAFCGANGENIDTSDEVLVMKKETPVVSPLTVTAAVQVSQTAIPLLTPAEVKTEATAMPVKKATAAVKAVKTAVVKKATVEISPEQQKINNVISQIKAKQTSRKAMLCDIVIKTAYVGAGTGSQESKAVVAIKKKDKFNVHFTSPMEQYMISDGKWIWIYSVDAKQVLKQAAKEAAFDMNFYIEIEDSIDYFVKNSKTIMDDSSSLYVLKMVPKDRKKLDFEEIEVKIEKEGLVLSYISMKAEGTLQEVIFTNVKNYTEAQTASVPELLDKNFVFKTPEGVEEIDTSGLINTAQ